MNSHSLALRWILPWMLVPLAVPEISLAGFNTGAAHLQIPPDVRAEGMGRAWAPLSVSPYAAWGNVGGLGLLRGVQFARMDAQLVPGLVDDVYYDYTSLVIGLEPLKEPMPLNLSLGFNRTFLSYGTSYATEAGSIDPYDSFEPQESNNGITFGVGAWGLLGFGLGFKFIEVDLTRGLVGAGTFGYGEATAVDYGVVARSPFISISPEERSPVALRMSPEGLASLRAVGGVGWSNAGNDIQLGGSRFSDPLPKTRRESLGVEIGIVPVTSLLKPSGSLIFKVLEDVSVISFSAGVGREKDLAYEGIPAGLDTLGYHFTDNQRDGIVTYDGFEVCLLDLFSYRRGSINDEIGQIVDSTEGWGVSILGFAGVDYAKIPQAEDLEKVEKWSWWARIPLDWLFD